MSSTLLAVDLPNLVARCWHASEAIRLSDGRAIHAINGAVSTIVRVMRAEPIGDLLIAIDSPTSRRRELDPSYKAHRKDRDPDLDRQLWACVELFGACGWPVVVWGGLEADDVLAAAARAYDGSVTVVTGDKDLLAVCSERVKLRLLRNRLSDLVCGPAECVELVGVRPDQLCDLKALAGDSSDGIPGVPGVGPKMAASLLFDYGSLAETYRLIDAGAVPASKVRTKLVDHREAAQRSWRLARLVDNLPLGAPWRAVDDCFGPEVAAAAVALGYTEVARRLERVPLVVRGLNL